MKKSIFFLLLLANYFPIFAKNEYNIIPVPKKIETRTGIFTVDNKTLIVGNSSVQEVV